MGMANNEKILGGNSMLDIRPAIASEQPLLRRIISTAHLDPSNLHWENFVIAEWDSQIAGIAQVKPYRDCREFGSLVVLPAFRKRGIASQLIQHCLAHEQGPIYLMCERKMESFYNAQGFRAISFAEAPPTLRIKLTVTVVFRLFGVRLMCMRHNKLTPHT